MTATDELRRLLDERGIEHMDFNMPDKFLTMFGGGEHDGAYTENSVDTILTVYGASPAQAVDATLGLGTCSLVREYFGQSGNWYRLVCSECHHVVYDGWQEKPRFCPFCGRRVVA